MFGDGFYREWRQLRFQAIVNHYGSEFFNGKRLLELGAAWGQFGALFEPLGATVVSYEGRPENFAVLQKMFPTRETRLFDSQTEKVTEHFDIILHCGLLYHLAEIDEHLANCIEMCDTLILETEVADKDTSEIVFFDEPGGIANPAAAIHLEVSRPTTLYLAEQISKHGAKYTMAEKPEEINIHPYVYDWVPENRGCLFDRGLRILWFIEK